MTILIGFAVVHWTRTLRSWSLYERLSQDTQLPVLFASHWMFPKPATLHTPETQLPEVAQFCAVQVPLTHLYAPSGQFVLLYMPVLTVQVFEALHALYWPVLTQELLHESEPVVPQ